MNLATAAQSSIGRKLINGFTGLLLVGFVIGHLIGNLLLLVGPKAFNDYAYFLEHIGHGKGLILAEIGLIIIFLSHAWSGWSVWRRKDKARKSRYEVPGDAGGASKKSVSSTSMLYTGIALLVFVAWHVAQFKFGIVDDVNRTVIVDGIEMRNLYGLVIDTFGNTVWTALYLVIMACLGLHLWHGAWSFFQSLGLANDEYLPTITKAMHFVAGALAAGFLFLPAYILLNNSNFQQADDAYVATYQSANTSERGMR